MASLQLKSHEIVNEFLLIQWEDGSDDAILLQSLRDNCPCANCAGEKDVFGNIYKGPPQQMTESSYQISGIQPVGYYAIRPFWKDGHHAGIFAFDLLKAIATNDNTAE